MKTKVTYILSLILLAFHFTVFAQMRVHLINVGQGCATLIEFPCAAILVDAGGESNTMFSAKDSLKDFLNDFFTRRSDLNHTLQCVYLTHPHADHTTGVPIILDSPFVIKDAVTDGLERGSGKAGQIALHRDAQQSQENSDTTDDIGLDAITTSEVGDSGITDAVIDPVSCSGTNPIIRILWGASATNPGWSTTDFNNENNHSLVIRIDYGASSLLITGDLEEKAIHDLLAKYANSNLLDADVYLVGHHGSKNGTTKALLDKITPKIALIGCGDPSRHLQWTAWAYGHPNKGTLDMLSTAITTSRIPITIEAGTGAKQFVDETITKAIYATAWDGNVELDADSLGHWQKVDNTPPPLVPDVVNINTATLSQLETLPGIGAVKAQAIIDYRQANGNFETLNDIDKVPGIGRATLTLIKPYITF